MQRLYMDLQVFIVVDLPNIILRIDRNSQVCIGRPKYDRRGAVSAP